MIKPGKPSLRCWLWTVLIAVGLARLLSLGAYPLADTTEARYGEIARLMIVTGDWLTPQISEGVPFWGKPPMSTWLAATSLSLFGINEFAARLPSFLLSLAIVALVWTLAAHRRNRETALAAAVGLSTTPLFFISSGAVMTDPALLLGTSLCMAAFWLTMTLPERRGRIWGYAFFVGLAIGLLAKGPVALILTGLPVGLWTLSLRRWHDLRRLPWVGGLLLTAVLSAPWYWLAEMKTPGFLEYFLIGEHWQRFIEPGWQGDLYGSGHLRPRGTIWLYWLEGALPWSLILPALLLNRRFRARLTAQPPWRDDWQLYLLLWTLTPLLFFSAARNILPTYALTGLPAFALLSAEWLRSDPQPDSSFSRLLRWGAAGMLLLILVALVMVTGLGIGPAERSQQKLVEAYRRDQQAGDQTDGQLIYLGHRPYSAEFYSGGTALLAGDLQEATTLLAKAGYDYLVIEKTRWADLPASFTSGFSPLAEIKRFYLLREKS